MSNETDYATFLQEFAEFAYGFLGMKASRLEKNSVVYLTYQAKNPNIEPCYISSSRLHAMFKASNHEALAAGDFRAKSFARIEAFRELLLRSIPALDNQEFRLKLDLKAPSGRGNPRFVLKINSQAIIANPSKIATVSARIERLRHHLRNVPASDAKEFQVAGMIVRARDAYDALRIHTALCNPALIDTPPEVSPMTPVHEVIDTAPLYTALFAEA